MDLRKLEEDDDQTKCAICNEPSRADLPGHQLCDECGKEFCIEPPCAEQALGPDFYIILKCGCDVLCTDCRQQAKKKLKTSTTSSEPMILPASEDQ